MFFAAGARVSEPFSILRKSIASRIDSSSLRLSSMNPTILSVDDSPANLLTIAAMLEDQYDVRISTSGREALELVAQVNPALILLDVMMPDMDGFETCKQLKKIEGFENIPIIFLTALSTPEDEVKCFEAGGADFVSKPCNPTVLRARIKTHIQLKQHLDIVQSLAMRDRLTSLYNRRCFDERINKDWRACQRAHLPLSVLLIDIDHFKSFNDTYGHQKGDECLRTVAQAILGQMRRGHDMAARYGGEEFVCLLPNADASSAFLMAERIRQAIKALAIPHASSNADYVITASIGLASESDFQNKSYVQLLKLADERLYEAKRQGRNRICSSS